MTTTRLSEELRGDDASGKHTTKCTVSQVSPQRRKDDQTWIFRRRNSAGSASIKSFKSFTSVASSITSRKRKFEDGPSLATMPREILDLIFQYVSQRDLQSLMRSNTNLIEVAAIHMYCQPMFTSTYRYAQFAWTVSHKEVYAQMVRVLDLSYFNKPPEGHQKHPPQAGWREFKYRHHDRYYPPGEQMAPMAATTLGPKIPGSSHPTPSPILKRYRRVRDLPIGGICHVLAACKNLRKVNFSRLQVAGDCIVQHENHKPTTFTGLIFVSDVPKAFTWQANELLPMTYDEIIDSLMNLQHLETIKAKNFLWLNTHKVRSLMSNRSLKEVDFRESGMEKNVKWAIRGSKTDVQKILRELDDDARSIRSMRSIRAAVH
ncbi:hypothetical protein BP6252_02014 [Coleophoma cylindrospora]|uniref:F-box domain-containing protein n=1 Tax=Coleophoma cylindrospora TaxID=1849047 RepID=A0A3D8SEA2_9HELO|nr:hypothetical protein BP6252_02014 [Coleophoma cylindrospora]